MNVSTATRGTLDRDKHRAALNDRAADLWENLLLTKTDALCILWVILKIHIFHRLQ